LEECQRVRAGGARVRPDTEEAPWAGRDVFRETVGEIGTHDRVWWQPKADFKLAFDRDPDKIKDLSMARSEFPGGEEPAGILRVVEGLDAEPPRLTRSIYQRVIVRDRVSGSED